MMLTAVLSVPSEFSILFHIAVATTVTKATTVTRKKRAESAESELLWTGLGLIIAENAGTWRLADFSLDSEVSKSKFLSNN